MTVPVTHDTNAYACDTLGLLSDLYVADGFGVNRF